MFFHSLPSFVTISLVNFWFLATCFWMNRDQLRPPSRLCDKLTRMPPVKEVRSSGDYSFFDTKRLFSSDCCFYIRLIWFWETLSSPRLCCVSNLTQPDIWSRSFLIPLLKNLEVLLALKLTMRFLSLLIVGVLFPLRYRSITCCFAITSARGFVFSFLAKIMLLFACNPWSNQQLARGFSSRTDLSSSFF